MGVYENIRKSKYKSEKGGVYSQIHKSQEQPQPQNNQILNQAPIANPNNPYNFKPEDTIKLKSGLNATLKRINDRGLSQERIEEIKETSPILNPEKYHKDVDAGYYGRKAAEGFARAGEGIVDAVTILGEH